MEFQNLSRHYDNNFKGIEKLKWLPWVGESYNRSKTIVIGESQYEDGDEWQEENINATRILIDKRFLGDRGRLYDNVEKVLLNLENPTLEQGNHLWKSVSYMNLVQRLMSSKKERPNDSDFDTGWSVFLKVAGILRPSTCIVLGKASCGRLGYYLNNHDLSWERSNVQEFYTTDKVINLKQDSHTLKLIFINHPSGSYGFSCERWGKFISDNEPSLRSLLMDVE